MNRSDRADGVKRLIGRRVNAGTVIFLVATALGATWWAGYAGRSTRREAAALRNRCAELTDRLRRADAGMASARGAIRDTTAPADETVSRRARIEIEKSVKAKAAESARFFERIENDPEFQIRYAAVQRAERIEMYRAFFRAAKLSPEQIARLGDAWTEAMLASFDTWAVRKGRLHQSRDPGVDALVRQSAVNVQAVEEAVLGVTGVAQLRRWESTLGLRAVIAHFAGKAALAGAPVDLDHVEGLVEILAQSDPGFRNSGGVTLARVDWRAASEAACQLLAPEQHKVFAAEAEKQRASAEFRQRLSEAKHAQAEAREQSQLRR